MANEAYVPHPLTSLFASTPDTAEAEIIAQVRRDMGPKELEPFGDCVVIRPVDADRTAAGLVIPEKGATAEGRKKAIVVAVGPGRMREDGTIEPMHIRVGDHVVGWKDAPEIGGVDFTGEELFLVRARHIACRVVPKRSEQS
jgi:chaperonin GroES